MRKKGTYELELILVGAAGERKDLRVVVKAHARDGGREVFDSLEGFALGARLSHS
jgi:hypothetical protein